MELKIGYIYKKIKNKIDIFWLRKNFVYDNLYVQGNPNIKKIKKILLFFPDYEMMHLGDHLFFEPLANQLKSQGFDLYIEPVDIMKFYFSDLGYNLSSINDEHFDLIISKIEFFPSLKNIDMTVLYIETANGSIKAPLCFDIIKKVNNFLEINDEIFDIPRLVVPKKLSAELLEINNSKNKYILFNNYVDSGSFRVTNYDLLKLNDFVINLKAKTGYMVIHTGSKKDKDKDKNIYDFVDLDLRGETNISDIFGLVQLDNVKFNVSFDAFQMHLFFIINKKSYIRFRGRFTKKVSNLIINYFNPPFYYNDKIENIIEYI